MFAKTIIDSDAFLDMPLSTQALYFHLSMRADDDGFINNPRKIQRMIGSSDDDLKLLLAKNFVIPFPTGVVVIKHWRIHNYIRADRKKDTAYPEEMEMLTVKKNGAYTLSKKAPALEAKEVVTDRERAYLESQLPYSFDYKIRQAFFGKSCPICGAKMSVSIDECGVTDDSHLPTIQHNIPISKGGKHELGNISVICHKCNVTIQDKETGRLNADEVISVWLRLTNDGRLTDNCRSNGSVGKERLDKDSLGEVSIEDVCTEPLQSSAPETAMNAPGIPIKGGVEWRPTVNELNEWIKFYSAVDVIRELGRMRIWCQNNPDRKKTARGIRRFVTTWLDKEQNRAGHYTRGQQRQATGADAYFEMAQEAMGDGPGGN